MMTQTIEEIELDLRLLLDAAVTYRNNENYYTASEAAIIKRRKANDPPEWLCQPADVVMEALATLFMTKSAELSRRINDAELIEQVIDRLSFRGPGNHHARFALCDDCFIRPKDIAQLRAMQKALHGVHMEAVGQPPGP